MRIYMMLGLMLAVFFLIDGQAKTGPETRPGGPKLVVEAIMHYYPNAAIEEAEALAKSEIPQGLRRPENFESSVEPGFDADQQGSLINTEVF